MIKVSELFGPVGYWTYRLNESGTFEHDFTTRHGVTQGEVGVGIPSVFLRTFGCSLECPSFGLPHGEKTNEPQTIALEIGKYKSVADLPSVTYGCDSYYSVYPEFKSLSPMIEIDALADQIIACAGGSFFAKTWQPVHLILTGGEPMLGWQRAYVDLIKAIQRKDPVWSTKTWLKLPITVETNCTRPLMKSKDNPNHTLFDVISTMTEITWSMSPKLTVSGHTKEEALHPIVIKQYLSVPHTNAYFKFVVQDTKDLDEVDSVVAMFEQTGIQIPVYIMPEGGTVEEYARHSTLELVGESVRRGYRITPRFHVLVGGNALSW